MKQEASMATSDRGLGSANMSENDKDRIHSMGGKASNSSTSRSTSSKKSDVTTNNSGGGRLDKEAQRKGGRNSTSN
jgi:hypothetical protein